MTTNERGRTMLHREADGNLAICHVH